MPTSVRCLVSRVQLLHQAYEAQVPPGHQN